MCHTSGVNGHHLSVRRLFSVSKFLPAWLVASKAVYPPQVRDELVWFLRLTEKSPHKRIGDLVSANPRELENAPQVPDETRAVMLIHAAAPWLFDDIPGRRYYSGQIVT